MIPTPKDIAMLAKRLRANALIGAIENEAADALEAQAARIAELEAGLRKIRDKEASCYRAADCQAVARALLEKSRA